jgi:xanthine dehydrogenase accessory factor
MRDWAEQARTALARGPVAMVTVLATEGSAPRGSGARVLVSGDGSLGTIGGGRLEYQAINQAQAILALPPGSWRVQDYPLGPLLGQCCGGRVRLMVEHLVEAPTGAGPFVVTLTESVNRVALAGSGSDGPILHPHRERVMARGPLPAPGDAFVEPEESDTLPVHMFGAGHVGRAIAERAMGLPLHLAWFDGRPQVAETPGVMLQDEEAMVACAGDAPAGGAVIILTHDHALDYRLTAAALRSQAAFVGLIGSATKRARFLSRLAQEGVDATRLTCPIGLPGIEGKEPEVIAIATLAQLLALPRAA